MKRIVLLLSCLLMAICAIAQSISRNVLLKSTDLGNQKLYAMVYKQDTTLVIIMKTTSRIQPTFPVELGNKANAIRLLNFLLDAELHGDDILDLENETHNLVKKNALGGFLVFSEGQAYSQGLRKKQIKSFIEAIEDFYGCKQPKKAAYMRNIDK